jgi:hypothetical protein
MALFSKKEFSSRCGMASNKLAVYVKRGKVIMTGDSIDDSLPQNQAFLAKHNGKPVKTNSVKNGHSSMKGVPKEVNQAFKLDLERKEIENERAILGKQLLQAKLGKQRGEMIPFEDVKTALDQHFRDVTIFFSQGIRNLLTEVAHKSKLNINQKVELNKAMERIVNDSVNRAIDATQASLRNIQKENSEKRDVGEKAA